MSLKAVAERLQNYLRLYNQRYPGLWEQIAHFRKPEVRGISCRDWPQWCYAAEGAYNCAMQDITRTDLGPNTPAFLDMLQVGPLAAWRSTQGIYLFDETLLDELLPMDLTGDLPGEVLLYLPEWSVYCIVEREIEGNFIHGFFASLHFLNKQGNDRNALQITIDRPEGLIPYQILLGHGALAESIRVNPNSAETARIRKQFGIGPISDREFKQTAATLAILINLVLYLCSENPEVRDQKGTDKQPGNPKPVKTRKGFREFPAPAPNVWEVGFRIGARLRQAKENQGEPHHPEQAHAGPRPHVRRAHWHHFWTGSRKDLAGRKLTLRWLNPILVNAATGEEVIPTVHRVKGKR